LIFVKIELARCDHVIKLKTLGIIEESKSEESTKLQQIAQANG
jgi:hypothetical protein